jgi:peptidoglycan hydrolase-like protein with peptidoglycan-binding domain
MKGETRMRRLLLLIVVLGIASPGAYARSVGNPDCSEKQYSTNVVAAVQDALRAAGLFRGRSDGQLQRNGEPEPATAKAIESWRRQHGLPVSGRIDLELLRALIGGDYPQLAQAQELEDVCAELTRTRGDPSAER